jgi:uncharacterized coiled-coil DUF342 family protein
MSKHTQSEIDRLKFKVESLQKISSEKTNRAVELEAEIQQLRSERDELMKALEKICNADESTDFGKAIDQAISTLNLMKEAGR